MNQIIAHGRLTDDVKMSKTFTDKAGNQRAAFQFSLACDRARNRERTDFLNCVWFLPAGNKITQYLTRGKEVVISGELNIDSYEAEDGTKRYSTKINVSNLEFAGSSKPSTTSASGTASSSTPAEPESVPAEDDLPF